MAETLLDVLVTARTALLTLGLPVKIAGDPEPSGSPPEIFVLDRVSSTARPEYGRTPSVKRLQVTAYARTLARALAMTSQADAALAAVGIRFIQQTRAPDVDHIGEISEYRS